MRISSFFYHFWILSTFSLQCCRPIQRTILALNSLPSGELPRVFSSRALNFPGEFWTTWMQRSWFSKKKHKLQIRFIFISQENRYLHIRNVKCESNSELLFKWNFACSCVEMFKCVAKHFYAINVPKFNHFQHRCS